MIIRTGCRPSRNVYSYPMRARIFDVHRCVLCKDELNFFFYIVAPYDVHREL